MTVVVEPGRGALARRPGTGAPYNGWGDQGQPPRPPRSPVADLAATPATLALVALTAVSASGFDRVYAGHGWVVPVIAMLAVVHGVTWATRRAGWQPLAAMTVGLAAVVLVPVWIVVPSTTVAGVPLTDTWNTVGTVLQDTRPAFEAAYAPVAMTHGFELLTLWGVGVVALFGDWAAFRLRSSWQGAIPGFVLFVLCSILGRTVGRTLATALEVAAIVAFVIVHRSTVRGRGLPWFGGRSRGGAAWLVRIGLAATGAAVLAAIVVTPILPHSEGRGAFGWKGGPGGAGGLRQVSNPIVDLHTRLLQNPDTPVFTVESVVPSYWRLTSLDTFTGQEWVSTDSYQGFRQKLPGVGTPPPGSRQVSESFQIQSLNSVWLPAAFDPVAVEGAGPVSYDPRSGSLLTAHPTSNALTYQVQSLQFLATLDPAQLAADPMPSTSGLSNDLQLPSDIPTKVVELAKTITKGQTTEYGKALALQNFFHSSAFSYSLSPPDDGYGISALTNFLFNTKTGYCQQFAGSYAVLARAIGLPTRLAYGFTTGDATGVGSYQVTDQDAHTWPEVYFAKYGWVPFEPTQDSSNPVSNNYAPLPAAQGPGEAPAAVPGSTGTNAPVQETPHEATPKPTAGPSASATTLEAAHHSGQVGTQLGLTAAALVVAGLVWLAACAAVRRWRWRHRRHRKLSPAAVAWSELSEYLAWWGVRRYEHETYTELADRAVHELRYAIRDGSGITMLAAAVTEADYAERVAGSDEANQRADLHEAARTIGRELWRSAGRRRRWAWRVDPRLAWHSADVNDHHWHRADRELIDSTSR